MLSKTGTSIERYHYQRSEIKAGGIYCQTEKSDGDAGKKFLNILTEQLQPEPETTQIIYKTGGISVNQSERLHAPYSYLADENGIIEYEGVVFQCDERQNAICLGDMSEPKKVLTIPLEKGGALKVNMDNIGELSQAIGMFSPADVNAILRAIAQLGHIEKKLYEMEEQQNQELKDKSPKTTEKKTRLYCFQ